MSLSYFSQKNVDGPVVREIKYDICKPILLVEAIRIAKKWGCNALIHKYECWQLKKDTGKYIDSPGTETYIIE